MTPVMMSAVYEIINDFYEAGNWRRDGLYETRNGAYGEEY